jgi:hypothetical protein
MKNIQINIKDQLTGENFFWIEDTETKLVENFSNYLFEKGVSAISIIDQVLIVSNCEKKVQAYEPDQRFKLTDRINEALEYLHDDYQGYLKESCENDYFYKMAVI